MISFKRLGGGGENSGAIAWGMDFFGRFSALPGVPVVYLTKSTREEQ